MEQKRSYRTRGTPDLPMARYLSTGHLSMTYTAPEYHPETELVKVLSGQVTIQLGGERKTFQAGDIFLIPGNIVHHYLTDSRDSTLCTLIFSPKAIAMEPEHFFQKAFVQPLSEGRLQLPPLLQPGHPAYEEVSAQFDRLKNCGMFEKDYQVRRFSALMQICTALLPYCSVLSGDRPPADPGNEAVKLCMRYIHNHYNEKITLDFLSQYCHVHPNYLCTLFKNYTGQTIFEYLNRYRIQIAARLLKTEDLPAGKVCELVGFRSESLFYQNFKAVMGTTPKAYAKQHRNK